MILNWNCSIAIRSLHAVLCTHGANDQIWLDVPFIISIDVKFVSFFCSQCAAVFTEFDLHSAHTPTTTIYRETRISWCPPIIFGSLATRGTSFHMHTRWKFHLSSLHRPPITLSASASVCLCVSSWMVRTFTFLFCAPRYQMCECTAADRTTAELIGIISKCGAKTNWTIDWYGSNRYIKWGMSDGIAACRAELP